MFLSRKLYLLTRDRGLISIKCCWLVSWGGVVIYQRSGVSEGGFFISSAQAFKPSRPLLEAN